MMNLPFEYPFSKIIKLSETLEKEKYVNDYLKSESVKNIVLEYSRSEKKTIFGVKIVSFSFWATSLNQNGENKKILVLSNRINDRCSLYDFIEYIENLSKKQNVVLINKFHNDGYSYDRRKIKRILTMPNNVYKKSPK